MVGITLARVFDKYERQAKGVDTAKCPGVEHVSPATVQSPKSTASTSPVSNAHGCHTSILSCQNLMVKEFTVFHRV